jgi:hypothetical protein
MPGPITYAAITLLARDRLGQIKRALTAKKAAGTHSELELHVLHLASAAEEMMSASHPVIDPPVRLYGPPLTDHVSRFTLLGAIGPDLPRYAAYFHPGQRWLYDTLHKGTPDQHREKVLANTTNLVFDFWKRVGPMIDAEFSDQSKRTLARDKMRAYVLGHLCHVAADVLSHPYFEAIEARLATPTPPVRVMSRDDVAGALDVRVADTFFGRGTDTRTKQWADWFPTPGEVPGAFAKAMAASIQAQYGARAEGLPAFEEEFKKIDPAPPPLSAALIEESIESFRTIIEIERVWTLGDWLGATAAMFLPMAFAYLGALVLPLGNDLSRPLGPADGPDAEDQRTYESLVFPLAASALGPLVSMIIVSASGRRLRAEGVLGWVQAGLSLAASVGFFATLGGAGAARWTLWFGLPLAMTVFQIIFVLARGARENSRKLLFLSPLVQLLLGLLFLLLYRGWLHEGVEELQKESSQRDDLKAFGTFAAWIAIVVALWFLHAVLWRWVFSASVPDDRNAFAGGEPPQFLRLYDDVGLVHDLAAPPQSERLADLLYPPARRPLLALWWEAGPAPGGVPGVKLRIDHDRLVFHWDAPADTPDLTVFAPLTPTTVETFGQRLAAAVTGNAVKGRLRVKPVRDDEKGLELAPGAVFSDHGDVRTTQADHDAEAARFTDIGTSEAAAFTLLHTPRPRLAQRMGRGGVAPDGRRGEEAGKADSLLQPVAADPRRYHTTNAGDGTSPLLRRLLRPGDVLEIESGGPAGAGEQRIVERVVDDTDVLVASPFLTAFPAAGIPYKRAASDRGVRRRRAAQVQTAPFTPGVGPRDVQVVVAPPPSPPPAVPPLGARFMVGDVVELATAERPDVGFARRTITAVKETQRIDVTIAAGGALGTATFTTRVGGGPVSASRPTGPAVFVEGTAITIFFTSGNYVAGDRWTIDPDATVATQSGNTSTGSVATTPRIVVKMTAAGAVGTAKFNLRLWITEPITVVIAAGGALGTATYTTRVGAGPVSAPAPTGTGVPVAGTMITLTFGGGTFVAGDSWTIATGGPVTPAAGNTSTGTLNAGPIVGPLQTAPSFPVDGTLTTLFFSGPGTFAEKDIWIIDPDGTVTAFPDDAAHPSTATVTARVAPRLLELDAPLPPFTGWAFVDRLSDAEADGFPFVADASDVFGDGGSVMNDAADLAALLCLAGASRLASSDRPVTPEGATRPVHRVSQVFRNWNLDRRRVNEWKAIVSGGAASERRGDFRAAEEAAPVDPADAGGTLDDAAVERRRAADALVRDLGWLGVFRAWVDMAGRARTDTTGAEVFRPGAPSNRELSRAMASLIDAADGVAP